MFLISFSEQNEIEINEKEAMFYTSSINHCMYNTAYPRTKYPLPLLRLHFRSKKSIFEYFYVAYKTPSHNAVCACLYPLFSSPGSFFRGYIHVHKLFNMAQKSKKEGGKTKLRIKQFHINDKILHTSDLNRIISFSPSATIPSLLLRDFQ